MDLPAPDERKRKIPGDHSGSPARGRRPIQRAEAAGDPGGGARGPREVARLRPSGGLGGIFTRSCGSGFSPRMKGRRGIRA